MISPIIGSGLSAAIQLQSILESTRLDCSTTPPNSKDVHPVHVMLAFGTRPEAIKMAPVVHALRNRPLDFNVTVCVTGQHRELLTQALESFNIIPDVNFEIMTPSQDVCQLQVDIQSRMYELVSDIAPDLVLVHGDTTTTLAVSLASFYRRTPVAHVEAGLRTRNLYSPFPEELNRQLVSRIAKHHFAPTSTAMNNLLQEGVNQHAISVTGNTVVDSLLWMVEKLNTVAGFRGRVDSMLDRLLGFAWRQTSFVLVTAHRRENLDFGIRNLCRSILSLSVEFPQLHFVLPAHLNPRVQRTVKEELMDCARVHVVSPVDYPQFVRLLSTCLFVVTDSGGIQEEAPSLNKPVLVIRDETERPEGVSAGTLRLVGTSPESITAAAGLLLTDEDLFMTMALAQNPYGDGHAGERIVDRLRTIH